MSTQTFGSATMEETTGRIPPQTIEMEKAVLGAVMVDSDSFARVRDLLDEKCFYRPVHSTIFTAMSQLDSA
ncbi:replicative DNA helicase, partial [bacterium]|nr:replicative DNA helicase [bacterium]